MEQKKVLWIVASLGIFLLVVFLGTLILYSPNNTTNNPNGAIVTGNDLWVNPNVAVSSGTTPSETIKPEQIETPSTETPVENKNNIINSDEVIINTRKTTVVSDDGLMTFDLSAKEETSTEKTETVVKPVETTRPTTTEKESPITVVNKPKEETPKNETASVITKPVEKEVIKDQYWVQAASFTSKQNAAIAQQALIKQKIPAEVFTYTGKKDVVYYRVRVGPYTTKSEAEYWNKLIQTVENFTGTETYVTNAALPANN